MDYTPLADLSNWELENDDQDIRGWKVEDINGTHLGSVDDLLVCTDSKRVELIRLNDNSEFNVDLIQINNDSVRVMGQKDAELIAGYRRYR